MTQNRGVQTLSNGKAGIVELPTPPELPADDYILVRTTAVAINPTDWKHVYEADQVGSIGALIGCDYAGIVEKVGPAVTKPFKKGDRICGPVNGSNGARKSDGSFATYITVKGDLQIHTPDNLTDEQAATLGIAITTVGQGLYQGLGLPLPSAETAAHPSGTPLFVYGGSTAMGVTGIQFAKLSGYTVIATASPRNFDYVRGLGADHVLDYNSPTLVDDVRALVGDKLRVAWDCISSAASVALCARVLSTTEPGVKIRTLLPDEVEGAATAANPNVTDVKYTVYYTVFGEPFQYYSVIDPGSEDYEFGKRFWELSEELLANGSVKPIRVTTNRGGSGLEGVLVGLEEVKAGRVSGEKLVYTL